MKKLDLTLATVTKPHRGTSFPKITANNARKEANANKGRICQNRTVCKNQILRGTSVAQIRKLKTNERQIKVSSLL